MSRSLPILQNQLITLDNHVLDKGENFLFIHVHHTTHNFSFSSFQCEMKEVGPLFQSTSRTDNNCLLFSTFWSLNWICSLIISYVTVKFIQIAFVSYSLPQNSGAKLYGELLSCGSCFMWFQQRSYIHSHFILTPK